MRTLLLTPWMAPHRVVSWERSVVLVVLDKGEVLEAYDEEIRSPSLAMRTPAVVRLKKGGARKQVVRFSRVNVYTRDGFRCQYCGEKKTMRDLNYDHVIARVRGGKTVWENIVTSCYACNDRKGSRTPEEAGMTLRRKPFKPSSLPVTPVLSITRSEMPALWLPYCNLPASEGVAGHRSTA
jgi:5-methylcytosine-specific restriction endonuclease McrA